MFVIHPALRLSYKIGNVLVTVKQPWFWYNKATGEVISKDLWTQYFTKPIKE